MDIATDESVATNRPSRSPSMWGGLLVSLIVHAVLLAVLGLVTFLTPTVPSVVTFDAAFAMDEDAGLDEDPWLHRSTSFRSGGSSEGGGSKGKSLTLPVTSAAVRPDFSAIAGIDAPLTDITGDGPINLGAPVAAEASGFGEGNGAGLGNGNGNGIGDGDGTYFGMKADRSSFVFVVDASGSMNRPYPGIAKSRFGRVKLELLKTISQMTVEQQFFVIFFADEAFPMPARDLVSATPTNQQQYLRWVANAKPLGNTEPETAIVMALRLKPEVIYFLTDGNFDRDAVKAAKRNNPTKIPIHTIGFGDNTGEGRMKELAADSGGTYRFIPEETAPTQAALAPAAKKP